MATAPAPDTDPLGAVLAGTAAWYRRRFRLRNCRIAGGRAVHAVRLVPWIGGVEVPAPACRVGIGDWRLSVLDPTAQPVTCGRCRRLRALRACAEGDPDPAPTQLTLL